MWFSESLGREGKQREQMVWPQYSCIGTRSEVVKAFVQPGHIISLSSCSIAIFTLQTYN